MARKYQPFKCKKCDGDLFSHDGKRVECPRCKADEKHARFMKKFDPDDPFPPYPPLELDLDDEAERRGKFVVEADPSCFDPTGQRARESAQDVHGLYPSEVEEQDAWENGYTQAVQDFEEYLRGE